MDQRSGHLEADRVRLLMAAAKAVRAYVNANPEPEPEREYVEPEYPPPHEVSSGA
jgi:hypothetical protein